MCGCRVTGLARAITTAKAYRTRTTLKLRGNTMTAYDDLIDRLADRINSLPPRRQAIFFWCSAEAIALYSDASSLDTEERVATELALRETKYIVLNWGEEHVKEIAASVRALLDRPQPEYSISIECAWMCLGCVARIACDDTYRPGISVEIVIRPSIAAVSEEMFGVYQIGSGPDEERQITLILANPEVKGAVRYCQRAIATLESNERDELAMEMLKREAPALVPANNI